MDWKNLYRRKEIFTIFPKLDEIVLNHVNNFWENYRLPLKINVEHKLEHTALYGVYTAKANYALLTFNKEENEFTKKVFRLRGSNAGIDEYYPVLFELHDKLLSGHEYFKLRTTNKAKHLLRLKSWFKNMRSPTSSDEAKKIRPGQSFDLIITHLFRDRHYPVDKIGDYKNRQKAAFTRPEYVFKANEKYSDLHERINCRNEVYIRKSKK